MLPSKYVWTKPMADYKPIQTKYHPKVEELLVSRGITEPGNMEEFLETEGSGYDPFLMKQMEKSVERIHRAVDEQEPILVYGDYDADGVTATAIMVRCLRELGAVVDYYIPNRFYEGYGPNADAFEEAVANGFKVVITVDNGISGVEEAKILAGHGVDLIITDHHHAPSELPDAYSIILAQLEPDYPFDYLAGAGVALKLAQALLDGEVPEEFYVIAMLGTVGDIVSLKGENRYLVKRGLAQLRKTQLPGLTALMKLAGTHQSSANEKNVGFEICPRLNAPGRMEDAGLSVQLLITDDPNEAESLARQIEAFNEERKEVGKKIEEEALDLVKTKDGNQKVLVLFKEDWHEGVLGIAAGKLAKQLGKAVFLLTEDEYGQAKGSGRAIEGFQLFEMLTHVKSHLVKFGGHDLAAGLTVEIHEIQNLEKSLNQQTQGLTVTPTLQVDLEVPLADADFSLIREFSLLAPFGEGNRRPVLKLAGVKLENVKAIGNKLQHLKFTITDGAHQLDGIAFNFGETALYLTEGATFDLAGDLAINEFNGKKAAQFIVADLRTNDFQIIDLRNRRVFEGNKSRFEHSAKLSDLKMGNQEGARELVLDVLPATVEELKTLIQKQGAKTLILYPYAPVTFSSRDKFIQMFSILRKYPEFSLNEQTYNFFEKQNMSKFDVNFILHVFFENEIVILNNRSVSLRPGAAKKELAESQTYRLQEARSRMYEFLELRTCDELISELGMASTT